MGIGFGSGDNRAEDAAKQAVASPLLETSIDGAQGILFNITAGKDITLHECEKAAEIVKASADPNANIIFGVVNDDRMQGEVKITVIATGFGKAKKVSHEYESSPVEYSRPLVEAQPRPSFERRRRPRHPGLPAQPGLAGQHAKRAPRGSRQVAGPGGV